MVKYDAIDIIEKIHQDMDETCFGALLKAWSTNDFTIQQLLDLKKKDRRSFQRVMISDQDSMFDILYSKDNFMKQIKTLIDTGAEDAYFSLNSFWIKEKTTKNVRHLNAIVMDFDYYKKNAYRNYSPECFYNEVIKNKLPFTPSIVMDSGRGLYVIYTFKYCTYHMQKLYKSITNELLRRFEDYGMDQRATNVTQVIRIPNTINTKTLREVSVLECNDTNYTIQDLAKILPFTQAQTIEFKKQYPYKKKKTIKRLKNLNGRKYYFKSFYNDLEKLVSLRKNNIIGYREYILFVVRERAVWSGFSVKESIDFAQAINDSFYEPLAQYDVISTARPSKRKYVSSLSTIMKNLKITEEEMKSLKMLATVKVKKAKLQKAKRKHKLLNRTNAEIKRLERRKTILYLKFNEKLNNTQIAQKLKITRQTVIGDLKYIKNNPALFMQKLEDYLRNLYSYSKTAAFKIKETIQNQFHTLSDIYKGYLFLENTYQKIIV